MKINEDLEIAKKILWEKNFTIVFVKNREVLFSSKESGISGFIKAIDKLGKDLRNSFLADKIVGLAIAMLSAYIKINGIYAYIISKPGIKFLKENKIFLIYEKKVNNILDKNKKDICPFEKIAIKSRTPEEVYLKIKEILKSF